MMRSDPSKIVADPVTHGRGRDALHGPDRPPHPLPPYGVIRKTMYHYVMVQQACRGNERLLDLGRICLLRMTEPC